MSKPVYDPGWSIDELFSRNVHLADTYKQQGMRTRPQGRQFGDESGYDDPETYVSDQSGQWSRPSARRQKLLTRAKANHGSTTAEQPSSARLSIDATLTEAPWVSWRLPTLEMEEGPWQPSTPHRGGTRLR
jgi:hypothetical protein